MSIYANHRPEARKTYLPNIPRSLDSPRGIVIILLAGGEVKVSREDDLWMPR
jgi:hypothetical protein